MTSALQPLASASSSTVLPVPKPPGIAALPPSATGNRLSRMRCPVTSGAPAGSRARTGRGTRTGQSWPMASSRRAPSGASSVQTASNSPWRPAAAIAATRPPASGGAMHCCTRPEAPFALAKACPGASSSPTATSGSK